LATTTTKNYFAHFFLGWRHKKEKMCVQTLSCKPVSYENETFLREQLSVENNTKQKGRNNLKHLLKVALEGPLWVNKRKIRHQAFIVLTEVWSM
jgi:hypothetical protein